MTEAISLGPFLIPTRPAILMFSILFAIWLCGFISRKYKTFSRRSRSDVEAIALYSLIAARLGFVVMNWEAYQANIWSVLFLWQPGYDLSSGLFFGVGYLAWQTYRQKPRLRQPYLKLIAGSYLAAGLIFSGATASLDLLRDPGIAGVGDSFPDFQLQNLDGATEKISDYAGQAVIINFWATWCPPCRREMPLLDELHRDYQEKGLSVIGLDVGESASLVRNYVNSVKVTYPVWVDAPSSLAGFDRTQQIFSRFGGIGLPTTIFIDRSGIIRRVYVGELSRAFLWNQAETILAE